MNGDICKYSFIKDEDRSLWGCLLESSCCFDYVPARESSRALKLIGGVDFRRTFGSVRFVFPAPGPVREMPEERVLA